MTGDQHDTPLDAGGGALEPSRAVTDHPPEADPGVAVTGTARARRRGLTVLVAVAALVAGSVLSGAGAVWAGHKFSDVPEDSPFHEDIDWMVDNGIAEGFDDGTYKPSNPVSRQAFAAFLHRYNSEAIVVKGASSNPEPGKFFPLTVPCGPDKRAIGGGGMAFAVSGNLALTRSNPDLLGGVEWQVVFETMDGSTVDPSAIYAWATCVPK